MDRKTKDAIIVGLIVAVVAGLAIIIVGEPLKAKLDDMMKAPQVIVENFHPIDNAYVGRSNTFAIDVVNQGNTVAQDCFVYFDDGIKNMPPIKSAVFSISPKDPTQSIQITTRVYNETETYNLNAYVSCLNFQHSNTVPRSWTVPTQQ